jgi:hypothetical protein
MQITTPLGVFFVLWEFLEQPGRIERRMTFLVHSFVVLAHFLKATRPRWSEALNTTHDIITTCVQLEINDRQC